MSRLNIAMVTDENYITQTIVTISSILSSAHADTIIDVFVLCDKNLKQAARSKIKRIEEVNACVKIQFLEVMDTRLTDAVTTAHIPLASYYRLYISQLIDAERCIFVDGDMIIREDLTDLYNTDLENFYIAGVKDLGIQYNISIYQADYIGLPDLKGYVNAGFLIMNLRKMREDQVDEKMIAAISHGYKYMDQDIINKYCYGKIKYLPLRYDFFTEYCGQDLANKLTNYSDYELQDIDHIAIYHYTGTFKPWLCTRLSVNQIWWDEAAKILEENAYSKLLENAREFERKSDWKYIIDVVDRAETIIIFGYSEIGRSVAERILKYKENLTILFADNDEEKIGESYKNIPVLMVDNLVENMPDAVYIISSQNGYRQIRSQLNKLGISSEQIIRYIHKDITYYARLDQKYVDYENTLKEM